MLKTRSSYSTLQYATGRVLLCGIDEFSHAPFTFGGDIP